MNRDDVDAVLSRRAGPRIEALWAVIATTPEGAEGVCRRDTPFGTQPWITDDERLAPRMLELAVADYPGGEPLRIAKFVRAGGLP